MAASGSDDEDDFMSDKFLSTLPPSTTLSSSQTYAEKRRLAQRRAEDRGRVKSRAEREREAREEALARDLIRDRDDVVGVNPKQAEGEGSKAVQMMMKMGFKPGQALGVKRSSPGSDSPKPEAPSMSVQSSTPGLGSGASSSGSTTPKVIDDRRTTPIGIHLRGPGRSGLGVPGTAGPSRPSPLAHLAGAFSAFPSASSDLSSTEDTRTAYLETARSRFDERKASSALRKARRTLEELDRREGVEESVMWLDPDVEAAEENRRLRRKMESGDALDVGVDDGVGEAVGVGRNSRLARLDGLSGDWSKTVVDTDLDVDAREGPGDGAGQDPEEREKARKQKESWMGLDAPTRLALTLDYLRSHHRCASPLAFRFVVADETFDRTQVLSVVRGAVRLGGTIGVRVSRRGRGRPLDSHVVDLACFCKDTHGLGKGNVAFFSCFSRVQRAVKPSQTDRDDHRTPLARAICQPRNAKMTLGSRYLSPRRVPKNRKSWYTGAAVPGAVSVVGVAVERGFGWPTNSTPTVDKTDETNILSHSNSRRCLLEPQVCNERGRTGSKRRTTRSGR